jgi:invasion protein IalB
MNRLRTNYRAIRLMFCVVGLTVGSAAVRAEELRRTVGDWQVVCQNGECRAGQRLANPKQPDINYGCELERVGKDNRLAMNLSFPLGIYLPRGIGVKAGAETRDVPMTVCLPGGCQALVMIDEPLLAAMKREKSFEVRFYTSANRPNEVTFSLDGFDAAQAALRESR